MSSLLPLFSMSVADDAVQARFEEDAGLRLPEYAPGLVGSCLSCPRVDGHLFQTYLSHFVAAGITRAPQQGWNPWQSSGSGTRDLVRSGPQSSWHRQDRRVARP